MMTNADGSKLIPLSKQAESAQRLASSGNGDAKTRLRIDIISIDGPPADRRHESRQFVIVGASIFGKAAAGFAVVAYDTRPQEAQQVDDETISGTIYGRRGQQDRDSHVTSAASGP